MYETTQVKPAFFSVTGRGIDLNYRGSEWLALEMNRDHSVLRLHPSTAFQTLVDYNGCSTSSKGFLSMVVDIMVI